MFDFNIVAALQRFFTPTFFGQTLEEYVISHRPTNTSEVENLIREYQFNQTRGWFQ